jgi:endonuclease YncB( thermonuclease family)
MVHVGPGALHPVVVPRYRPRPLVVAGAAVVVAGGARVIGEVTTTLPVAPAETVVVPSREFTPAEAYQVLSVRDDYVLSLLIDGQATPVRLLGVEPPLVAPSEGQPGVLPDEALQFVRSLLLGEYVYLDDDAQVASSDADGIRVAYLYRAPDGLSVNLEIIRQGYALTAEQYSYDHRDTFTAYQSRVQALGKGIWAGLYDAPAQ